MPAIARELRIPDALMSSVFSLSALLLIVFSPLWARLADRFGRKPLIILGLGGYSASMLACGMVVIIFASGHLDPAGAFVSFLLARSLMGLVGAASGPATQAYIADRTSARSRAKALSAISGAFGMGSVIGPFLAPLFIGSPLGLAGPMFIFSAVGVLLLAIVVFALPVGHTPARTDQLEAPDDSSHRISIWKSRTLRLLMLCLGLLSVCYAGLSQTLGFMIIDLAGVPPSEALAFLSPVMAAGAAASVLSHWVLVPTLALTPTRFIQVGAAIAAAGSLLLSGAQNNAAVGFGYAIFVLGTGIAVSGCTSAASLAASSHNQATTAGLIMSINGGAFLLATGFVALYTIAPTAPFLLASSILLGIVCLSLFALR